MDKLMSGWVWKQVTEFYFLTISMTMIFFFSFLGLERGL